MIGCGDHDHGRDELHWDWIPIGSPTEKKGLLKHTSSGKCLKPDDNHNGVNLLVDDCDETNEKLVWQFDYSQEYPA